MRPFGEAYFVRWEVLDDESLTSANLGKTDAPSGQYHTIVESRWMMKVPHPLI